MIKILNLYNSFFTKLHYYTNDIIKLSVRLYVSYVFFRSGMLKISSWDSTLYLFELEYQVPIIPWELAAYLATAAELILPVFLVFGVFSRLVALKLFIFNIIAVISYSVVWNSGFYDHKLWGAMLLFLVIYGSGKFSVDRFICKKIS